MRIDNLTTIFNVAIGLIDQHYNQVKINSKIEHDVP